MSRPHQLRTGKPLGKFNKTFIYGLPKHALALPGHKVHSFISILFINELFLLNNFNEFNVYAVFIACPHSLSLLQFLLCPLPLLTIMIFLDYCCPTHTLLSPFGVASTYLCLRLTPWHGPTYQGNSTLGKLIVLLSATIGFLYSLI